MTSKIKGKALEELIPGKWVLDGDTIIILDDSVTLSQEDFIQKCAEVEYKEEVEAYKEIRSQAYPPMSEQLDKIFHEGIDAWKLDIQAIKDAHPKAVMDNDILVARKGQALFNHQLEEYTKATARLSQYQVSVGAEQVAEEVIIGEEYNPETGQMVNLTSMHITQNAVDPVEATVEQTTYDDEGVATTTTIENPLITQDNAERAEAQAIVDATPQSVIDTYNE